MKTIYLTLLSFASLACVTTASAGDDQKANEHFSSDQVKSIHKVIGEYLVKNPDVVMTAFQTGMENKQKEEVAKIEEAVVANKDKIFKNENSPSAGNQDHPTQSLVVFLDPNCGYCKKFHGELDTVLKNNKNVKITFIDVPIMGAASATAIKAMLAANIQGKYNELQKAIFTADSRLSKKQILKMAGSLGIDTKKLEADMKSKEVQAQLEQNSELVKILGVNGTPTLIIGENKVIPGFVGAEELNKMLNETTSSADKPSESKKAS
jgi:protein-disulfide isomerase